MIDEYEDIMEILNSPGKIDPSWRVMKNISTDHVHFVDQSLLMIDPLFEHATMGSCMIPVFIDPIVKVDVDDIDGSDKLSFYKRAELNSEGIIEIRTDLTDDMDHILP